MRIFDLDEFLPTYKAYDHQIIMPSAKEAMPQADGLDPEQSELLESEDDPDIPDLTDNNDPDYVLRNMKLGKIGEDYVAARMLDLYGNCKKPSDRAGYDFDVYTNERHARIEVKTIQRFNDAFHITINEIDHAKEYGNDYYICFAILRPSSQEVAEVRFLKNPIDSLGITIPGRYPGAVCEITPEKFLIKPVKRYVKNLPCEMDLI